VQQTRQFVSITRIQGKAGTYCSQGKASAAQAAALGWGQPLLEAETPVLFCSVLFCSVLPPALFCRLFHWVVY
jgi:hypothetical protein